MEYVAAVRTDVGRKRSGNEDSYCLAPDLGLFVVADGMGGHAAGEVASRLAVETIQKSVASLLEEPEEAGTEEATCSRRATCLLSSIRLANQAIFQAAQAHQEYANMGTTLVAILTDGERVALAHVGDSRIYRIREGEIVQVSRDHSVVQQQVECGLISREEAHHSQFRHLITRALGLREAVEVDIAEEAVLSGDVLLLCSDGLSDLVEDEEMLAAVLEHGSDLEQACQVLVDRANYRGGDDNITALLVQARAEKGAGRER